jgi:RNA polymerase sigma factor (TIGR02999 family)
LSCSRELAVERRDPKAFTPIAWLTFQTNESIGRRFEEESSPPVTSLLAGHHDSLVSMSDITQILGEIEAGTPGAADELLGLVYDELRALAATKMMSERLDHTLQGTALVHEAYLRLFQHPRSQNWASRGYFFAAAAEAMRRVLIDYARQRNAEKRNRDEAPRPFERLKSDAAISLDDMLDFDHLLVKLEEESPQIASLVKLRVFAGLSVAEAADVVGIPTRSAYRDWAFAQTWLFHHLNPRGE